MEIVQVDRYILASKLASGNATVTERDNALAQILLSLWTDEELDRKIDTRISSAHIVVIEKKIDDKVKSCRDSSPCQSRGGFFSQVIGMCFSFWRLLHGGSANTSNL